MQPDGDKVKEIIAELMRVERALKAEIADIYGFRVLWVRTVNGVIWGNIANFMY